VKHANVQLPGRRQGLDRREVAVVGAADVVDRRQSQSVDRGVELPNVLDAFCGQSLGQMTLGLGDDGSRASATASAARSS